MRGELDDALERLRRRNEVRQRLAGEPVKDLPEPVSAGPFVPAAATPPPPVPVSTPPAPIPSAVAPIPPASAPVSPAAAPIAHHAAPLAAGPESRAARPDVLPPRSSGPAVLPPRPAGPGVLPPRPAGLDAPMHPTAEPNAQQGGPVPAEQGPLLPGALEEALTALGDVVRRHPGAVVMVAVEEAGTTWTAHITRGDDGHPTVGRLESRSAVPNDGGQPPYWPGNTGRSAEAIQPMPVPNPVSVGRTGEPPERVASRLAEAVRRDPSLLKPPGEVRR